MHATRIIAIRHGETAWNVDTRIQGHLDIPLNDTGLWQADQVARALADEPITAIYTSDLQRAHATAQAVDLSPEQPGRPRSQKVDDALKLLPPGFKFAKDGVLTVGTTTGRLPFGAYATDNKTPVGNAPDIAQLIADRVRP